MFKFAVPGHARTCLQDTSFGSASFKTCNDGEILIQANNNVPTSDPFWTGFAFNWDDVWFTRDQELRANYPAIRHLLPE